MACGPESYRGVCAPAKGSEVIEDMPPNKEKTSNAAKPGRTYISDLRAQVQTKISAAPNVKVKSRFYNPSSSAAILDMVKRT